MMRSFHEPKIEIDILTLLSNKVINGDSSNHKRCHWTSYELRATLSVAAGATLASSVTTTACLETVGTRTRMKHVIHNDTPEQCRCV